MSVERAKVFVFPKLNDGRYLMHPDGRDPAGLYIPPHKAGPLDSDVDSLARQALERNKIGKYVLRNSPIYTIPERGKFVYMVADVEDAAVEGFQPFTVSEIVENKGTKIGEWVSDVMSKMKLL